MVHVELIDYMKPWPLFRVIIGLSLGYLACAFFRKWRGWSRGIRDSIPGARHFKRPFLVWLAEVLLQRQLLTFSFSRWLIHVLIFYGFIGLTLLSATAVILSAAGYLTASGTTQRFYLHPEGYLFLKVGGDSFGLLLLLGLVMASIRRVLVRRVRQASNQMDGLLLALLVAVTLSGFTLEGLRIALMPAEIARYSFIGRLFSPSGSHTLGQLHMWLTVCWTLHFLLVATLIVYIPHSKLMHSLLAPVIIGLNAAKEYQREDLYWPEKKKYRETGSPPD